MVSAELELSDSKIRKMGCGQFEEFELTVFRAFFARCGLFWATLYLGVSPSVHP